MSPLFALAGAAFAWEVKTNSAAEELHWEKDPVEWGLNTEGGHGMDTGDVEDAAIEAAASWSEVPDVEFSLDYQGATGIRQTKYGDDVNLVYFESDWEYDEALLAVTSVWSIPGGEITAFDIAVNLDFEWSADGEGGAYDLQNALTHEFGHGLGLDHSSHGDATMYGSTHTGETSKRTLDVDDEQAARYLYSPDGIWQIDPEASCSSAGRTPAGLLAAALAVFAVMARRRGSEHRNEAAARS